MIKTLSTSLIALLCLFGCAEKEEELRYRRLSFSEIPSWQKQTDFTAFQQAFSRSCQRISYKKDGANFGDNPLFGTVEQWKAICNGFAKLESGDIKNFLERNLQPFEVIHGKDQGLFTGYYEPLIEGQFEKGGVYQYPIYRRPNDLVQVNLDQFDPELKGKRIVGRIAGTQLLPYPTRKDLEQKKLLAESDALLWLKDPVDVFFLQIQGSGKVNLPSGRQLNVGFAAHNGREYHAIGRYMINQGLMKKEDVTLKGLQTWLRENPDQQENIFHQNDRYVFFRLTDSSAKGAQGAELTAQASLAIDPQYQPLGLPLYVETNLSAHNKPWRAMMVGQDTGGAIKGPIRGDIFFGNGTEAEDFAGQQNAKGKMFVFAPRV